MTGNMNGLSTRSGDTDMAMDGIAGRELWEAGRIKKENTEVSNTEATDIQVEQEDIGIPVRTVRTRVVTNRSVQEKYQEQKSEEKAAQAKADAIAEQLAWVEENLIPADVDEMEEEATPYEKYTSEQLERAVQRVKEGRTARREGVERQVEKKRETREQLKDVALSDAQQQLAQKLEAAGMPVTQANLAKLANALEMAELAVGQLGEQSFSWLMENQLESSVSNLYQASLMNTGSRPTGLNQRGIATDQQVVSGLQSAGGADAAQSAWEQIEPQAMARLEQEGVPVTEETMKNARWLFEHGQAIDGHNMAQLASLKELQGKTDENLQLTDQAETEVLDRLTDQLAKGGSPADAVLGDARWREAEYALTRWEQLDVSRISDVTARRQMEEIRLKLTTEVAVRLLDQGIRLDTENLNQIVEGLKALENSYYQKLCAEQGVNDSQTAELLREVVDKRQEMLNFSCYSLGSVYRSAGQITFEAFYEEGQQLTAELVRGSRAEMAYETMSTEVRPDLGDSMSKAFRSVDSLLDSLGVAVNEANERAVRILGYNHLEITQESVTRMRYYDSRVTETLEGMKPGVVLEMIRSGQNPLEMTMEELGDVIDQIPDEVQTEESYSRFLWKLEKQHGISQEERSAYIGIYRLLHQIEKSDGAAIGAVVEAGQELTLQNLLTAVRTRRSGGVDRKIDDNIGERETATRASASITEQIAAGYTARELRHELERPEEDYRQWQTEKLTEQIADSKMAVQFLEQFGMESTPVLLAAAKELLSAGWISGRSGRTGAQTDGRNADQATVGHVEGENAGSILTEFVEELSPDQQELLRQEGQRILDSLGEDEPAAFREQVRQLQETMLAQIRQQEQSTELTFDRLQQLRSLGQVMNLSERLTRQEHYEIPVVDEDGRVSCIRLTVRHEGVREAAESESQRADGRVELALALPETGEPIKGDFWIQGQRIEGYFRCETRPGQEEVQQKLADIQNALQNSGYEVGSLTCHLLTSGRTETVQRVVTRNAVSAGEHGEESGDRTAGQTKRLYQAAKAVIDVVRHQEGEKRV